MGEKIYPGLPTLHSVEGATSDAEAAQAIVAGQNAPERLSFDPQHPDYDRTWCARLRDVQLNGKPVNDLISFDIRRGYVEILVRDERGKEQHTYEGPRFHRGEWPSGRLRYKTTVHEGHVTVKYGLPVKQPTG